MSSLAVNEDFAHVQLWFYELCHRFRRYSGRSFDEIVSEAGELYVKAYARYDNTSSSLTNWMYQKIWFGLICWHQSLCKEAKRRESAELDHLYTEKREPFDMEEFCQNLSLDAIAVVTFVIESPAQILETFLGTPGKREIKQELRKEWKWSSRRVARVFKEIQEAL